MIKRHVINFVGGLSATPIRLACRPICGKAANTAFGRLAIARGAIRGRLFNEYHLTLKEKIEPRERKRGYELKYNKWYIGLSKNGISKNFIFFKPGNKFVSLRIKADENSEITELLEQHCLDLNYDKRENCYKIKIGKLMDYKENEEALLRLIDSAIERMGLM